jgi:hypothetical protein
MRIPVCRTSVLSLIIALGVLVAPIVTFDAYAQEVGSAEQISETARLQQRVEELEARLKKLEEKFEKPFTVKAPFTVTDGANKPMFQVGQGGNKVTLGNPSSPILYMGDEEGNAALRIVSGKARVGLIARGDGTAIAAATTGEDTYARLIASPSAGAITESVRAGDRGYLGVVGGGARVKLEKGKKQFFLVDAATEPSLKLGDEKQPGFEVSDGQDAIVSLKKNQASLRMATEASGISLVRAINGGGHSVAIESGPDYSVVEAQRGDPDWIQIGMIEGAPALKLVRGGKTTADIGTPEGKNTALRIYDKDGALAVQAGLGSGAEESSSLSLWRGDNAVASLRQDIKGEAVFEIRRAEGQLAAQLGRVDEGKGTALRIFDTSGKVAVGAGLDTDNNAAVRVARQGKTAASMSADEKGNGRVQIAKAEKAVGFFGVNDDGRPALRLADDTGIRALALEGLDGGDGSIKLYSDGNLSAHMGPASGKNTALRFFMNSETPMAAIGIDATGNGAVRVGDTAGTTLAGLAVDSDGGGSVVAYHKSGRPAASLAIGDGGVGSVQVYTTGGVLLGSLTQGVNGGILQLNDMGGTPMVEAGTTGGRGIVRTGPMVQRGGILGLPGSYIMGKQ